MENNLYALVYIHSHQVNSTDHYSMIFKYMADVEFKTLMFASSKRLEDATAVFEPEGYQLTLIYDMDTIDFIAVFQKTDAKYSHVFRAAPRRHLSMYEFKSSQNETLISTNIKINRNNRLRYTSVYLVDSIQSTEHLPNLEISALSDTLQSQFSRGFHLSDLSNIRTVPPTVSVVFTKMTETHDNYKSFMDLGLEQTKEIVETHLREGFAPLVIVGLNTTDGLKFSASLKQ